MLEGKPGVVNGKYLSITMIWEGLRAALDRAGIDRQNAEKHVNLAKSFFNEQPVVPLRDRSSADVERFLSVLAARPGMETSQVARASLALRVLYREVLGAPWALGPDSGGSAPSREQGDVVPGNPRWRNRAAARSKPYPEILNRLRTAIRTRHYSPRTALSANMSETLTPPEFIVEGGEGILANGRG